jgi:hypothetical protein
VIRVCGLESSIARLGRSRSNDRQEDKDKEIEEKMMEEEEESY